MAFTAYSPWIGCHHYSRGCLNCFIRYPLKVLNKIKSDREVKRTTPTDALLDKRSYPSGSRVFLCPLSDFLIEEADEWREELWAQMKERHDLELYVQTKRIVRLLEPGILPPDWGEGYPNVYFNATIDDPRTADDRMRTLVEVPSRHRVIALTPCTCPMDVRSGLRTKKIQQAYLIGEIGCGADWETLKKTVRPLRWEWVRDISDQFKEHSTHFDFKSTGTFWYDREGVLHTYRSMREQFQEAQSCRLEVVGSDLDYTIGWGSNHDMWISDWSQAEPCCSIHESPAKKVFY
jgi:protein gp37